VVWTEVAITVPRPRIEAVSAAVLTVVPAGCAEVRPARGATRLLAYVPAGRNRRGPLARLRAAVGRICPACRVVGRPVSDASWMNAWKAHARPVRIGRLAVVPSWWRRAEPGQRAVVRVDPGQAFGSGEHASTQLCLEAVDRYLQAGARVIDVGTGSGVLAIACAALGAARVVAVDSDPVAVRVARANCRANGVAARVRVIGGDGLRHIHGRADLIIANLTAETLPPILARVRARLRPGGRFVGAGFTTARLGAVAGAARAAGLRITAMPNRRGWRAIHAQRAPQRPRAEAAAVMTRR
jgi:ribosomal protein L11 methyltransferase